MKLQNDLPAQVDPGSVVSSDDVIQAYTEMLSDAHRQIALLKAQNAALRKKSPTRPAPPDHMEP